MGTKLNIFYEEPNPDRWFRYDRFPRKLIRRIIRGKEKVGGMQMVALQLLKGLDVLKIPYRYNDYRYAKKNPDELIGAIGKPHLIFEKRFQNPIIFGASVFSHPSDCPDLFKKYPNVKKILVPGEWMRKMFEPYYGDNVKCWPVGIDTEKWNLFVTNDDKIDFLIYEKFLWNKDENIKKILNPILKILENQRLSYHIISYGSYKQEELLSKLHRTKAAIFLSEHETQGLAYQQILSTNTPILAFDKQGYWLDPAYYPHKVKHRPVTSVPYWDDRCGIKFSSLEDFNKKLTLSILSLNNKSFMPRSFILENLSLEICAERYRNEYFLLKDNL